MNWLQIINLKKIQNFVDFCNFYRRFIKKNFKLAKFLTRMTRKKKNFAWSKKIEYEFQTLKKNVTKTSILRHYDRSKLAILKTNSFDWIFEKILSQKNDQNIFHFVIFLIKTCFLSSAITKSTIKIICHHSMFRTLTIKIKRHWKSIKTFIDHKKF